MTGLESADAVIPSPRARRGPRLRWPVSTVLAALAVGVAGPAAVAAPTCGSFAVDPIRSVPGHSQVLRDATAVPGTSTAWAVGFFHDNTAAADVTYTARWNGRIWKHVESPSPGREDNDNHYLLGVSARTPNDVWAVGYQETSSGEQTLIEHWNGRRWKVVDSVDVAQYQSLHGVVAVSRNDVWAVGRFFNTDHDPIRQETLIQHWNGKRWKVVPSPNLGDGDDNRLLAVTAVPGTDQVVAVGHHQWEDPQPLVLVWDGAQWTTQQPPAGDVGGAYLNDVAAAPDGKVWAVGFSIDDVGAWHGLAARWNGSTWTSKNPAPPTGDGYNPAFGAVTVTSSSEVWAVGFVTNANGAFLTLAERWDGTAWEVIPSANPGGFDFHAENIFNGVAAISPSDVHTVGFFHAPGFDPNHALFESWCP